MRELWERACDAEEVIGNVRAKATERTLTIWQDCESYEELKAKVTKEIMEEVIRELWEENHQLKADARYEESLREEAWERKRKYG